MERGLIRHDLDLLMQDATIFASLPFHGWRWIIHLYAGLSEPVTIKITTPLEAGKNGPPRQSIPY